MNDSDNIYGFSSNEDTHMLRNMDWGAAAYFSYSKYGAKAQIFNNNSYNHGNSNHFAYTGRSGGNVAGSTAAVDIYGSSVTADTVQYIGYGYYTYDGYLLEYGTNTKSSKRDLTKVASTTGNIYGIYDMIGGEEEHVMGNMVYSDGVSKVSGYGDSFNSGYTGISGYGELIQGMFEYPEDKYFDQYSYSSDSRYRKTSKLGDAIRELTASSFADNMYRAVPYKTRSWILRGSEARSEQAGIFTSYNSEGRPMYNSSRFAIKMTN